MSPSLAPLRFRSIPASWLRRRLIIKGGCPTCGASSWLRIPSNDAFARRRPVCRENFAFNDNLAAGDIFFGTTIVYPRKVGLEYHLTRGHYHRRRDRAETYQALSGRGLVLFERDDGTTRTAELVPGRVTNIPPFWRAPLRQYR